MKRLFTRLLSAALAISTLLVPAMAMPGQYGAGPDPDSAAAYTTAADTESQAKDLSCYDKYSPRTLQEGETLRKGVDISYYQGNIDWKAAAESGIEFAFVRVAYRTYGTGVLYDDQFWERNIKGAQAAGIKVGVYIFSQAISVEEAQEEADYALKLVKDYKLELPVVLDYEFASNSTGNTGRLYQAKLGQQEMTDICNAFCTRVQQAGRIPMVYANMYMLMYSLYADQLQCGVWLAHYTKSTGYAGDYDFWQCSDSGQVPGIDGTTDIDFWYDDGAFGPYSVQNTVIHYLPFADVQPGSWSYDSILYCYEHGIIYGVSETAFAPLQYTTRGQVVAMLYRTEGNPAVTGETPGFTDLTMDYYKKPVQWAWQKGIVYGRSEVEFSPDSNVSREDFVTFLYRAAGCPKVTGSLAAFDDTPLVSAYAEDAMLWATQNGIMYGVDAHTLNPQGCATRQEVAAFITRYMTKIMGIA